MEREWVTLRDFCVAHYQNSTLAIVYLSPGFFALYLPPDYGRVVLRDLLYVSVQNCAPCNVVYFRRFFLIFRWQGGVLIVIAIDDNGGNVLRPGVLNSVSLHSFRYRLWRLKGCEWENRKFVPIRRYSYNFHHRELEEIGCSLRELFVCHELSGFHVLLPQFCSLQSFASHVLLYQLLLPHVSCFGSSLASRVSLV